MVESKRRTDPGIEEESKIPISLQLSESIPVEKRYFHSQTDRFLF